tara:strand:- start:842 stop:1243 length:402 start_codon:yes stop_codon:yes gene_type:complete
MIIEEVIKIASKTKFYGLKDIFTHKSSFKNKTCGDTINIELVVNKNMIKSLRYETKSCIFCQASASILAHSIKSFKQEDINNQINFLKSYFNDNRLKLPKKFNSFKKILSESNINRFHCVFLPLNALLKALKN